MASWYNIMILQIQNLGLIQNSHAKLKQNYKVRDHQFKYTVHPSVHLYVCLCVSPLICFICGAVMKTSSANPAAQDVSGATPCLELTKDRGAWF